MNLEEFGVKGLNYYWAKKEQFNISTDELIAAGVTDGSAYIDKALVTPLQNANKLFQRHGYELVVKDGFRTPELYQLVQKKRYAVHGKKDTDILLNVETMPHATGRTVDIALLHIASGQEVIMRRPEDRTDAFFVDFYRDKPDTASQNFQQLQQLMIGIMQSVGFVLGVRREFWHFEYPQ